MALFEAGKEGKYIFSTFQHEVERIIIVNMSIHARTTGQSGRGRQTGRGRMESTGSVKGAEEKTRERKEDWEGAKTRYQRKEAQMGSHAPFVDTPYLST